MRPTMISRQMSESSASERSHGPSKRWRGFMIKKMPSIRLKEEKHRLGSHNDSDSHDSLGMRHPEVNGSSILHESHESNSRQLREIVQRMKTASSGPKDVDIAYDVFDKYRKRAQALCLATLQDEFKPIRNPSNAAETLPRRDSSLESPNAALYDQRSSFSGRSLSEVVTGSVVTGSVAGRSLQPSDAWVSAIRDWKLYVESLAEWFRISLTDTYRKFDPEATSENLEALFNNKRFRRDAVSRMRNASVTRVMSADPQFFPRYEIRFRNYERVKQELTDIRGLLQSGESGINPDRLVEEITISSRGDAILEFANIHPDALGNEPVVRFRVSSAMLAETSPIFARMFNGHPHSMHVHDDDDITAHLPGSSTKYFCKDGTEAKLYRMPQFELNRLDSMSILLYAAHMHNEHVPREVSFEQFVAVADCSTRYKSTSPLELRVEHHWLPQWMRDGADEMPDGLLAITYAFGKRQLFTRMSKSAILNIVDETDLQSKPWPQRIKDKIWAVRNAKIAQLHACCTSTIQEYICQPSHNPVKEIDPITPADIRTYQQCSVGPAKPALPLSSTPRCPKGSHWCDAVNLGWMMLVFNEMNLLSHVLRPNVLTHLPDSQQQPSRSLAQIVEALRRVPSPVSPIHHGGVCNPIAQFQSDITDIFNSVTGLTLHDVSGKSHGWALSKHREAEPQATTTWGLKRMAVQDHNHSVASEFPEAIRLKILAEIDDIDDLHATAMTSHGYYSTYKTHELYLMRNILRIGRFRSDSLKRYPLVPRSYNNAEEKVPKEISDDIQRTGPTERFDSMTLRSEDDDDDDDDFDCESLDGTPAPSITMSLFREMRSRDHSTANGQRNGHYSHHPNYDQAYIRPPSHPPPSDYDPFRSITSSTPTTPRATTPPAKPAVADDYEPPLTDEEARRILWPDADADEKEAQARRNKNAEPPPPDALREKFRFGDPSFMDAFEEKTLGKRENQQAGPSNGTAS